MLLTCLGPALAWACSPAPHKAWTKRSPNGRFTLSMKGAGSGRTSFARGPLPLTLRNARKKVAESRSHGTAELLFEALLQLAMEAKKQNWQDDLSQRVHDVLAYPSSRDFFVSERSPPLIAQAFTLTAAP